MRSTSNGNAAGSSEDRRRRKAYLVEHYRAAVDSAEPRTFEAHYPAPLDAWYEIRAYPGPDGLSVYFLDAEPKIRVGHVRMIEAPAVAAGADLLVGVDDLPGTVVVAGVDLPAGRARER